MSKSRDASRKVLTERVLSAFENTRVERPEWFRGLRESGDEVGMLTLSLDIKEVQVFICISPKELYKRTHDTRFYDHALLLIFEDFSPEKIRDKALDFFGRERERLLRSDQKRRYR